MPRAGSRPYDCFRRAWHSDRHQPVRGSLIKEIFSVVSEIHSSATRKNKEWQEKLPVVVLKAEEIMYSKANSEAEYTDLKTLWERINDAINTIIRRDESLETGGEFLQPCIEAALQLGCVPRRASRSQRYSNPRCYLSPITTDVPGVPEKGSLKDNVSDQEHTAHCSNFLNPIGMNSIRHGSESSKKPIPSSENIPLFGYDQCFPRDMQTASNIPIYFGKCPLFEELKHGFVTVPKSVPKNHLEPALTTVIPNLFCNELKPNYGIQKGATDNPDQTPDGVGCDLSLRLGSLSSPFLINENKPLKVREFSAHEEKKCADQPPQLDKEFSLFHNGNEHIPVDMYLGDWNEFMNPQPTRRKRKPEFDHPTEDAKFCRQPELPFSRFSGSMGNGDL